MDEPQSPIQDCPVFDLQPIGGTYLSTHADGKRAILIGQGGVIQAQVSIPYPYGVYLVHGRSRYARSGLEFRMLHTELRQRFVYSGTVTKTASIFIHNHGRHPVLVREGDLAVAVADHFEITRHRSTIPHTNVCPEAPSNGAQMFLSIGDQRLQIVEERLPLFQLSPTKRVRFIDPLDDRSSSYGDIVTFEEFSVRPGDFFVVNSREFIRIPHREVALLYSVTDDFVHSSALLIYPGSEGYQTFEFIANRPAVVRPGVEVMMLSLYQCPIANGSGGRYVRQNSLTL